MDGFAAQADSLGVGGGPQQEVVDQSRKRVDLIARAVQDSRAPEMQVVDQQTDVDLGAHGRQRAA